MLTSDRTFSAAGEFAYDLQSRKRAAVVGATSGGGAHAGGPRRLDEHFEMWVPAGEAHTLRAAQVLALQGQIVRSWK